ncbi:MAG: RNA polymerase sigma-70 factor [Mangrovibacterium sp.]|nr:RNA polymerase sigma-70 factor [Mangrovibacterium sp.]
MSDEIPANSDHFVLTALCEGQGKAFDFIFRNHYKALCAQANVYLHDLDLSQSLVQDCFIKLWEIRKQTPEIQNLSSWLSVAVRNRCIDYLRRQKKETTLDMAAGQTGADYGPDVLFMSHEFEERLVKALLQLPDRCRTAFEYSRFDGLTYPEIASRMNISVKGVEALVSRSLKILRVDLKDYLPLIALLLNFS